jgi:RNA polymerase sigma-70 factor (ECF subfamily)
VDLGATVVRAQAGDAEAFRLLYRDIQPRLLRYLHALAGPDAEDLAAWPAADDTAARALDAVATAGAIALIATLPPDQAEAVLLRAVLGLDAATAAQVLGQRPAAIRTAAHRGLRTLHSRLEDGQPELTNGRRTRGTPSR